MTNIRISLLFLLIALNQIINLQAMNIEPILKFKSKDADTETPLGYWTLTGELNIGRTGHTTTLLDDGRVLVTGGHTATECIANVELYDPLTESWAFAANMMVSRCSHTATKLLDGRVLITGGRNTNIGDLGSSEIFDPVSGLWTFTGNLNIVRSKHTANLLLDGSVLVVGGTGIL